MSKSFSWETAFVLKYNFKGSYYEKVINQTKNLNIFLFAFFLFSGVYDVISFREK